MRGNLQNAVNQEVAYHKVTDQVVRALPYGNVNNRDTNWNLQNAVNQEVAYHKVTDQVVRALPYGNVNNRDTNW